MGNIISKKIKKKIDDNWSKLKCSDVGNFLQMAGIAGGDAKTTQSNCKSSSFNSMFSKNMSQYTGKMNMFSTILEGLNKELNSVKTVINSIKKQMYENLQKVATKIFILYAMIGKIFMIFMKHIKNILNILKYSLNMGIGLFSIIGSLINIIRKPINFILRMF